jgi:hypothetical protein
MTQRRSELMFRGGLLAASGVLLTAIIQAQSIPTDPKPTCVVSSTMFSSWFESGTPAPNGAVTPANSVTFNGNSNCAFYQWSERMFLWLTSPAPSRYGGDARVFDSPVFYDVSPVDANNQRHFLPHVPGQLRIFSVRAAQAGPHGLPIVFDRQGRMFEVERPEIAPSGRQLIRNAAGSLVEVGNVTLGANKRLAFADPAGKAITPLLAPRPAVMAARTLKNPLTVRRFLVGGKPTFIDPFGSVIDVETGQAGGGGALVAQNGSLIYYTSIVNDVYAYFLSGAKTGGITPAPTQFPTTSTDLGKVTTYASGFGVTFEDPNALAIEVKAAWIETTNLPGAGNYITMSATIPTYDTSNPDQWVPTGQRTAQLAMVGMHVVGSTAGHPEMLWATFEHLNNAPAATYQYVNTSNQTVPVNQNTSGTWIFTANGAAAPFNAEIAQSACNNNIYGIPPSVTNCPPPAPTVAIKPSNVIRWKPWGAAFNSTPNPLDASAAASNTEIISIHNTVTVPGGDVRNNYFMTGTTWTIGGAAPNGSFSTNSTFNEVGTSLLANTTMETFQQGTGNTSATGTNCFTCHTTNTTSVSHVYGALQPLTPAQLKTGK